MHMCFSDVLEYLRPYHEGEDGESAAWLLILMHRFFRDFSDCTCERGQYPVDLSCWLSAELQKLKIPEFVGQLVCKDLSFGEVIPSIEDIRVLSWRGNEPIVSVAVRIVTIRFYEIVGMVVVELHTCFSSLL